MKVIERAGRHWRFGTQRGPKRVAGFPGVIAVHGHADSDDAVAAVAGAVGPATAAQTGRI